MLILVTGPESSGTRWLAGLLSQHPDVKGTSGGHIDPLDSFWAGRGAIPEGTVLTRRSLPSGIDGGKAEYMGFPDLDRLPDDTFMILTVRSPYANLVSWAAERNSARGDVTMAANQYDAAYKYVFSVLKKRNWPYFMLPLEAVILDGAKCVESIWELLGLRPSKAKVKAVNPNTKRY